MSARVTVRGVREAKDRVRASLRELDVGQANVLHDLADLFRKGERQIFATRGSIIGKRWSPLADSTAKQRARLARRFGLAISPRDPVLVLFGDLRRALTEEGGAHQVRIEGRKIRVSVEGSRINRHNRVTGAVSGLTKKGQPRKVRGRGGRYPENIVDIHNEGLGGAPRRVIVGIPPGVKRSMDARAKRWFDRLAALAMG